MLRRMKLLRVNNIEFHSFSILMSGIQVSSQNVSRTGITPRQTEQLYDKMSIVKRQMIFELFNQLTADKLMNHMVSSKVAVPDQWLVQCLDTWRYVPFSWPNIHFQRLPEVSKQEDLFKDCMKVLEVLSLPICYSVCRYENLRKSGGQVLSIEAPIDCLSEFVRVHKMQGDNGNHFHELRIKWKDAGLSENLFRQMAMIIFKFRQHGAVPFLLLHSLVDNKALWICFRDYAVVLNDAWLKGILQIVESSDERIHPNTQLKTCQFVDWPILEHSDDIDIPKVMCQNLKCYKGNEQMVDEAIRSKFQNHKGPREKLCAAYVKRNMGNIWHDKYEPMLANERDEIIKEQGIEGDKEKEQKIQNSLLDKYEDLASVHEEEFALKWKEENCMVKMKRCSKCKRVYYCSADCQKVDWSKHKLVCPLLTQ